MASSIIGPIADAVIAAFRQLGVRLKKTSEWRSIERQRELYENRGSSPYPVARPGRSQHEYGLAVDMVADPRIHQNTVGEVWNQLGLFWNVSDPIHFAVFSAQKWREVLDILERRKILPQVSPAPATLPAEAPPVYPSQFAAPAETLAPSVFDATPRMPTYNWEPPQIYFGSVDFGGGRSYQPFDAASIPAVPPEGFLPDRRTTPTPMPSPIEPIFLDPVPDPSILALPEITLSEPKLLAVIKELTQPVSGLRVFGKQYPRS